MTYRGRIRNGLIVLEGGVSLPEGAEVLVQQVQPADTGAAAAAPAPHPEDNDVWLKLLELAGTAQEFPADLPERHDHYRRQRLER